MRRIGCWRPAALRAYAAATSTRLFSRKATSVSAFDIVTFPILKPALSISVLTNKSLLKT